jgi:translocation and assembly module TamA
LKLLLWLFHKRICPSPAWLTAGILIAQVVAPPVAVAASPHITINGGPDVLRDNVRHYLSIAEEPCDAPEWRLKALLNDAEAEIRNAAEALGFYQLKFTSSLTQQNNCWQLALELTPGPPVNVAQVHVVINGEGYGDGAFQDLQNNPGLVVGERLNHGIYENLKNRISTLAASRGYFDGKFDTTVIRVDVAKDAAEIELVYDTGPRYRIGEIRIKQDVLREKFVKRYLSFKTGDYYDTDTMLELKSIYNATGYFNIATATPDLQNLHDKTVDVDIVLEERKRHSYAGGIGIATDTGPRIRLGFEDRYVNDRGHSINADMSYSNIKTTAQLYYTIPMKKPSYEFLKIYTGYEKEDTDTLYSNKRTYGTSYSYYRSRWLHTYAVNIENETSIVGAEPMQFSHLLIPSYTLTRTETDGNPYPLRGWSLLGRLSGSPTTLGSDVSYLQGYARAKYIYSFERHGRLLVRTEVGLTQIDGGINELPGSVRFFAGGDNSVRGYDYKSLGPTKKVPDEDDKTKLIDKVVGGNNLWVGSIEYDYRIKGNWAAAAFYDLGNAADDTHLELKRGVGAGIRYISPIGPVRLDVARALDEPKGWAVHISMGPDL